MSNYNPPKEIKKELPWSPTKSQVFRMYIKFSQVSIRDEMKSVMAEHRKISEDKVRNIRRLYHPEFVKIVKMLGIPKGYYAPEGFFDETK